MVDRILNRTALIVMALAMVITACAPAPTREVVEKTVAVEKTVVVREASAPELVVVTFVSWAEEEFEQEAIEKMLETFAIENPGVEVKFTIVTPGGTYSGGAP